MSGTRIEQIRATLEATFAPSHLAIQDDSARHAGHASAGGGGHFQVEIVSNAFTGLSLIKRHRLVYDALGEMMASNAIHALSIKAHTPDEYSV